MSPKTQFWLGALLFFIFANLTAYMGVFGQLTAAQFTALTRFELFNKIMEMQLAATVTLMAYVNRLSSKVSTPDSRSNPSPVLP